MQSNMVSPFAMHQQQLVMLAQHQSLMMAAATANSVGGEPKSTGGSQQTASNGTNLAMNWPNVGYQIPGMTMPAGGQVDLQKLMQVKIGQIEGLELSLDVWINWLVCLVFRQGTWEC